MTGQFLVNAFSVHEYSGEESRRRGREGESARDGEICGGTGRAFAGELRAWFGKRSIGGERN